MSTEDHDGPLRPSYPSPLPFSFAAKGGPGGVWAHADGAARLRALRRARIGEVHAKDLYERGKFEEAAAVYTKVRGTQEGAGV